jgi:hypothetical protein
MNLDLTDEETAAQTGRARPDHRRRPVSALAPHPDAESHQGEDPAGAAEGLMRRQGPPPRDDAVKRKKSQPGPPMTLGNAAAARVRVIVWCRDCGRQVEPDPAEQAGRYGGATSVLDWRERLVCSRCGISLSSPIRALRGS